MSLCKYYVTMEILLCFGESLAMQSKKQSVRGKEK